MPRRKTVGRKSSRGHQGELILKTGPKKRHSKVATMPRTKTKARKSGTGIAPVSNGTQPQLVLKTRAKKKRNPVANNWNYRNRRSVTINHHGRCGYVRKSIRTATIVQLKIKFSHSMTRMTEIMREASYRAEQRKYRIQQLKRQIRFVCVWFASKCNEIRLFSCFICRENNGVCNDDPIDESGDEKQ